VSAAGLTAPGAALLILLLVEVTNTSEVLGMHQGLSAHLVSLGLAVAVLSLGMIRGTVRPVRSPVLLFAAVFFVGRALSIAVASDRAASINAVMETAHNLLFLYVVVVLLCSTSLLIRSTKVIVVAVGLLAGLSALQEFVLHNGTTFAGYSNVWQLRDIGAATIRHSGPQADANFWGRTLALFVPLALSLWAVHRSSWRRWAWGVVVVVLCLGEYLTQSRGGLIALAVAVFSWFALAARRYARALVLAPLVAGLLLLAVPGLGSRLATLKQLPAATAERGDESLTGRAAAQRIGLAMFRDRPSLGVGAGNFESLEPEYERTSGLTRSVLIAPHNVYLEMAAEGGVVGLTTWLLFYGSLIFVALRALLLSTRLAPTPSPTTARLLAAGLLAGLIGWAVASIGLHLAYTRVLFVVGALAIALDIEARRAASVGPGRRVGAGTIDEAAVKGGVQRRRRAPRIVLLLLALFVAGASLTRDRMTWVGKVTGVVVPIEQADPATTAYDYDVLTREFIVPTYADVLSHRRFESEAADLIELSEKDRRSVRVGVNSSPAAALLSVTARSEDRTVADQMAEAVFGQGTLYLGTLGLRFVVNPVRYDLHKQTDNLSLLPAAALLVVAAGLFQWLSRGPFGRR
jgi:O-antigen ligase